MKANRKRCYLWQEDPNSISRAQLSHRNIQQHDPGINTPNFEVGNYAYSTCVLYSTISPQLTHNIHATLLYVHSSIVVGMLRVSQGRASSCERGQEQVKRAEGVQ